MKAENDGFDPRDIQHCDNLAQLLQDLVLHCIHFFFKVYNFFLRNSV